MSKEKPRNLAASVRQRLLNLSRTRGEDFQFVLTRYALERFLYRLSQAHLRIYRQYTESEARCRTQKTLLAVRGGRRIGPL